MTPNSQPAPTRILPDKPNLAQPKKQAKELLRAYRSGDPAAAAEVSRYERAPDPARFALADAQRVLARAYGFESWRKLAQSVQPDRERKASRRMSQPKAMATETYQYGVERMSGHDGWALMCACADGDVKAVEVLLKKDARLANVQYWYQFPIHMAVREGHTAIVKLLLDSGADPGTSRFTYNAWDKLLATARHRGYREVHAMLEEAMRRRFRYDPAFEPLKAAIIARDLGKVRDLVRRHRPLLHASDCFGNGLIHWAALTRQCSMIDEFVKEGADIDARRADGQAPIHVSINDDYWFRSGRDLPGTAIRNRWVITGYLLGKGAKMDLCVAAAVGDSETARRMLAADPDAATRLGPQQKSPLTYAAAAGHTGIVKLLLEHGADPNLPEWNAPDGGALFAACAGGYRETVELLLQHSANPNAEIDSCGSCFTIIELNNPHNFKEIQSLLRKHGAVNTAWNMNRQELEHALRGCDRLIYSGGAVGTDWGDFLWAVLCQEDPDLLALYIDTVGAEPIRRLTANHTLPKSPAIIDLLVQHGLDVNQPDWRGRTFLHACAEGGNTDTAAVYLKYGADINAIDVEFSHTPLGAAARCGKIEMVKFLLDHGADPNLPEDRLWARPLAYAESEKHSETAALLLSRGAKAVNI